MAKPLSLFALQLLVGVFWTCHFETASSGHLSVHPGENITLPCNVTNYAEISWYRLRSEEVTLLISAKQGNVKKNFLLSSNLKESHIDFTESGSSVSLMIAGVRETDLGFYYCGGKNRTTHTEFGKPIRLNFTDDRDTDNSSEPKDPPQPCTGTELWIIRCVCLLSVLINLICMCVCCCRFKEKSESSSSCCRNNTDTTEKNKDIHYASIQHERKPRTAAKKNTASDSESVTYATVASQPRRH